MHEALLRFGLDPMLAALFLALATAGAWALLLVIDRFPARLGAVVGATSEKLPSLEGLRGVLAFSVAAHHACCWYYFSHTGVWSTGRSVLFDRLSDFGVTQFFYLSGFLFWRKLMKRGRVQAGRFYLSRFVRIGPVYYACVGLAIAIGMAAAGFKLRVSAMSLITSLLPWVLFSVGGQPEVNHADILRITCGVTWTLALEWLFYLSLPFLAWFSRQTRRLGVYVLVFGALFLLSRYLRSSAVTAESLHDAGGLLGVYTKFMLVGFGGGMLVAALETRLRTWLARLTPWRNWIAAGCYALYLTVPGIAMTGQVLLLAAFALVVGGADLFSLLAIRPVRFLGVISYPVYLLHGLVYYVALRGLSGAGATSPVAYMAEIVGCLAAILLLAAILHQLVERPTMKISERIARAADLEQSIPP